MKVVRRTQPGILVRRVSISRQILSLECGRRIAFEDLRVDVLERDIEIREYFIAGADGFDEAFGNSRGVEIKKSNPAESRDFGEVGKQFRQGVLIPRSRP